MFNLGVAYSRLDMYEKAIPMYEGVLRLRPDHARARSYLDRALTRTGG